MDEGGNLFAPFCFICYKKLIPDSFVVKLTLAETGDSHG